MRNTATNELLVDLIYGTSSVTGDWRKGKLVTADRYNYLTVGTTPYLVQLRETFTYGGPGGRPSALSTFWANSTTGDLFLQGWSYDDLGNVTRVTYPRCAHTYCSGPALTSRLVDFSYTNSTLTSIPGYASPISYNANGTLASVAHANGVTWSQTPDPNSMPRPAAIQATAGMSSTLWSTGTHSYDGEGNVRAIGASSFIYDPVSRLTSASMITGPLGTGGPLTQSFTYDGFGNMTAISGSNGRNIPTSSATNRLTTVGAGPTCEVNETYYDAAGNLLCWQGNSFTYDPLGSLTRSVLSGVEYDHAYNAAGERLLTYQPGVGFRWTFRDLDGRVLREFKNTDTVERDYVYRQGTPLASVQPTGEVFHLHPDHLGSPRLITGNGGLQRAFHTYFAFGEEATTTNQDAERLKFTGHERDLGIPTSAADDIDYQHARYYSQLLGRYLSPDLIGGDLAMPQSWNRYAYALGSPMKYVDPYGMDELPTFTDVITVTSTPIDEITVTSTPIPWWFGFVNRSGGGPSGGSVGGAGGQMSGGLISHVQRTPGGESNTRDCTPVENFFDAISSAIDWIGPVTVSGTMPLVGKPGIVGLGPVASATARPDGSADLYLGFGFIVGTSVSGTAPSFGGTFLGASTGRPRGVGIRGALAVPLVSVFGLRAAGFMSSRGSGGDNVGAGAAVVGGASASLSGGGYIPLADPLPPRVPCP